MLGWIDLLANPALVLGGLTYWFIYYESIYTYGWLNHWSIYEMDWNADLYVWMNWLNWLPNPYNWVDRCTTLSIYIWMVKTLITICITGLLNLFTVYGLIASYWLQFLKTMWGQSNVRKWPTMADSKIWGNNLTPANLVRTRLLSLNFRHATWLEWTLSEQGIIWDKFQIADEDFNIM